MTSFWSRHIDEEHWLADLIEGYAILIFACWGHYN
ncbi:MAG: type II toxin-antitoxin system YoeB family toxin [Centipeda sp. (in: firmicutes)]|nr:type II toxin-antitoxin system YoeB family toxin [Selenomonas sp. oral taxon 920]